MKLELIKKTEVAGDVFWQIFINDELLRSLRVTLITPDAERIMREEYEKIKKNNIIAGIEIIESCEIPNV